MSVKMKLVDGEYANSGVVVGRVYEGEIEGDFFEFLDSNGALRSFFVRRFEAVDMNAMPELEAGMVVRMSGFLGGDHYYLYVHNELLLNIYDGGFTTANMHRGGHAIEEVFDVVEKCCLTGINVAELSLIWQREPEKTETEKKIEELQQKLDELRVIAEKEKCE